MRRVDFPEVLWAWIAPAWKAAAAQLASEPDPEDGYRGHRFKHERPHLVPLGYILLFTPILLLVKLIESVLRLPFAVPFITTWVPFALMGGLWSLALYIGHRRATKTSAEPAKGDDLAPPPD